MEGSIGFGQDAEIVPFIVVKGENGSGFGVFTVHSAT